MPINIDSPLARRIAAFAFLVSIFGLTFWVLSPFLAALAWAGILAYVTWPLHMRLCRRLPGHDSLAALLMTLGVGVTLLLPMVWAAVARDHVGTLETLLFWNVSQAFPETRPIHVRARDNLDHFGITPTLGEHVGCFVDTRTAGERCEEQHSCSKPGIYRVLLYRVHRMGAAETSWATVIHPDCASPVRALAEITFTSSSASSSGQINSSLYSFITSSPRSTE